MATLRLYPSAPEPQAPCENCPARGRIFQIWAPLQWPARAAVVLLGHLGLALLLIAAIWVTEWSLRHLYGEHGHMLFGILRLDWLFDVMDLSILILFIGWGLFEANRELKGD
jgi:hypothetical protein